MHRIQGTRSVTAGFDLMRAIVFIASATVTLSGLGGSARAGVPEGYAAYLRGDYVLAMREFLPPARRGDPAAQIAVGWHYDNGLGVLHDDAQAFQWYRRAARQGCAIAQSYVGSMLAEGAGIRRNYREARRWLVRAADQGEADAYYILGLLHRDGLGARSNAVEAYKWFALAAESEGDPRERARAALDQITALLRPQEMAQAQRLTAEWRARVRADPERQSRCLFGAPP